MDKAWLAHEAEEPYRLGESFLSGPLHVVNGVRVGTGPDQEGPQGFAKMLLLSQDHLNKRAEFDFFLGATFVPEIAVPGNSLVEIAELCSEAARKLSQLPSMPDDQVTATIYELLVVAAWVRRGVIPEMVPGRRTKQNFPASVTDRPWDFFGGQTV